MSIVFATSAMSNAEPLLPPQHANRDGKATGHIQLYAMPSGINQHATLELLARLISESSETCSILGLHGSGTLDLDSPKRLPTFNNEIHFNLIFVAVVRKAQLWFDPRGLSHKLLNHMGFQQGSETLRFRQPLLWG